MPERPRRSISLRLFVAVYPPREVASGLLAAMEAALVEIDAPEHRVTPVEQVHLTMQFIGDVPRARLEEVTESVARSASGLRAATLTPRRLLVLPQRGPARLVAAEGEASPTLRELKQRLATRLARNVRRESGREFLPHLTLCRFHAPRRLPPVDRVLSEPAFSVTHVELVRSVLRPGGAEHTTLERFSLA